MTTKEYKVYPLYMDLQVKNLFGTERNVVLLKIYQKNILDMKKGDFEVVR